MLGDTLANSNFEHPIAALATATPGAIAVIRCSGERCIDLVASVFDRPTRLRSASGNSLHHGYVVDAGGVRVDEVVAAIYRAPASYTGEDVVEVFCHGSASAARLVLTALLKAGFRAAEPGEFTRRAFLNSKLDLTQAEAVNEVVRAQTSRAHALAVDRLNGSVAGLLARLRARLVAVMSQVAALLDYPEEDTPDARLDLEEIRHIEDDLLSAAATYDTGRILQEGVRVAIAGRTNAGKSALFNQILRQDRSIVSDTHGTTRDYIEALVDVRGIPVRLFDTAGLRSPTEAIEEEGIRRTRTIISAADLVLYVVAADAGFCEEDTRGLEEIAKRSPHVVVWNKVDIEPATASKGGPETTRPADAVPVCSLTGEGIDDLNRVVERLLLGDQSPGEFSGEVVIDSARQYDLLTRAAESLRVARDTASRGIPADAVAVDLQDALDAIGEITGEIASAEILDAMFGAFCVGK
jgi:tRNA modification GTPase